MKRFVPFFNSRASLGFVAALLAGALGFGTLGAGATASEALLDRVPPDASMVILVEDLGAVVQHVGGSPFFDRLSETDAARRWRASPDGRRFQAAIKEIEATLGLEVEAVLDGLLGESVALSLHWSEGRKPEEARGLFQTKINDRTLLQQLIGAVNASERASGQLERVAERSYRGRSYSVRTFNDGRPAEAYVLLEDATFVWTNAERLLREVIDRRLDDGTNSILDRPAVARAFGALAGGSMARLYIDPAFLGRLSRDDPDAPRLADLPEPIADYLLAIEALGVGLDWRDGPALRVVEVLDRERVPEPVRAWAARSGGPEPLWDLAPPSALAMMVGHLDFAAIYDLVEASLSEPNRPKLEQLRTVARGFLLDRDPRLEVLPDVGPGVVGWLEPPEPEEPMDRFSAVVVVALGGDGELAPALENGLRTLLAMIALEPKNVKLGYVVQSREWDGVIVTALTKRDDASQCRLAFAIKRDRLVIGLRSERVAAALTRAAERKRSAALEARAEYFPDASTFAYVNLDALTAFLEGRRSEFVRLLDARRDGGTDETHPSLEDLDRLLEVAGLFRGLYLSSRIEPDASMATRRLGLIVDDPAPRD